MKNYKIAEMFLLNNTAQRQQSLIGYIEGREEGVKRKMKNIRGKGKITRKEEPKIKVYDKRKTKQTKQNKQNTP